jgi:prolyl-tRNA synthetase
VKQHAGCYILRPYAHQIWDKIHSWFDERIAALGVENCYFPLLITKKALETEASHVEGFAAEVGL